MRVGFIKLDPRILPEMGVKVAFRENATTNAASAAPINRSVSVPKDGVQQEDGRDVVFVVEDGRARRRSVTVASQSGDETVISAGVTAGERVISGAPKGITDGAAVRELRR